MSCKNGKYLWSTQAPSAAVVIQTLPYICKIWLVTGSLTTKRQKGNLLFDFVLVLRHLGSDDWDCRLKPASSHSGNGRVLFLARSQRRETLHCLPDAGEDRRAVGSIASSRGVPLDTALVRVFDGVWLDHVNFIQAHQPNTEYSFLRHPSIDNTQDY